MRTFLLISSLLVFILPVSTPADASGRDEIIGFRHVDFIDGSSETLFLIQETNTGRISLCSIDELKTKLAPTAWQLLIVYMTKRWPDNKKTLRFELTPLANNYKKKFNTTLRKMKNARRGTSKVPKFKVTASVVKLQSGTNQFNQKDGINTIVMTPDDRYFWNMAGVAAYCIVYSDNVMGVDGITIKEILLTETDVFFPLDFFWQSNLQWQTVLIHEFGHTIGYDHSAWTNDYMSYRRQLVSLEKLNDKTSNLWATSQERDRIYYPAGADDKETPRLLPLEGTVIDIHYMHAPDPQYNWIDLNRYHPVALTNLKSFPGNNIELAVYHGPTAKGKPFIKLTGNEIQEVQNGKGNLLLFGKEALYKKLKNKITKNGKPKTIDNHSFGVALEATIVVKGYLTPDDNAPVTLTRTVVFVDAN